MTDSERLSELMCDYAIETNSVLCDGCGGRSVEDVSKELADHLVANGVTFQKWIPVTERLPDTFGEYIVAVEDVSGQVYSDYADYDPYQKKWTTGLFLGVKDKITHWMPLPEPPKEVNNGQA